ncbi:DUF1963 domain-containing protein [Prosthecobacter sp. SYSU 5D2]|uniref:DUF1963 domain-containing protein n=1 Tax=Prosthecobacter sp. SYSU 5D2 TaxID=3134134 RepID=UPI0031FE9041
MPLFTEEELKQLPEFDDLNLALRDPEEVFRFRAYRLENAADVARIAELENLQSISISFSDVSQLLPRLGSLKNLQAVYLQACNISDFPQSLFKLRYLRSLFMGNNSLTHVAEEIGDLVELQCLGLSQNKLRQMPESIGRLSQLKTLVLSYNELEMLPEAITKLEKLDFLSIDVNHLKSLPNDIGNLSNLECLSLDFNKLTTLPDCICRMPNLRSLSLENNPFVTLPEDLSKVENLSISIEASKRAMYMDWSYTHSVKPPQVELKDMRLLVAPGSQMYQPFLAAIQEAQLADMSEAIVKCSREAIALESSSPDDYSQKASSRLGGFPDLPDPSYFPKTDGFYWIFLAQLNLEEIAPLNSFLPRSGLLSFFLDDTEALNGKVLYNRGDFQELTTVRHAGADEMLSPEDDYTEKAHRIKFGRFISCPHSPSEEIADDLTYEKWEAFIVRAEHHINGYTFTQHESPQELAAKDMRGQAKEWVPLLKLGWDANVGFCFWDAGTVTFSIHQEDLRREDFSNVHVSLESS